MKRFLCTLALTLGGTLPAVSQQPPAKKPAAPARAEVLVLGTYHMANPGRDIFNMQADDVLAPKRQAEIAVGSLGVPHPSGAADMTGVQARAYYCDTRSLDEARVEALLRLLSEEEPRRHARFSFAHDRRDYAAAHALLRLALTAHTKTPAAQLSFGLNAYGKPVLLSDGGGAGPPSFSLAHSRGLVACVIASGSAVGIDVEEIRAGVRSMEIARRFFAPEEAAALESCSAAERPSRFCELWTLKEALLNAAGAGLACPLDRIPFQVRGRRIRLTRTPPFAASGWEFLLRDVEKTHKLSIAVAASGTSRERPRIGVTAADPRALVESPERSSATRDS